MGEHHDHDDELDRAWERAFLDLLYQHGTASSVSRQIRVLITARLEGQAATVWAQSDRRDTLAQFAAHVGQPAASVDAGVLVVDIQWPYIRPLAAVIGLGLPTPDGWMLYDVRHHQVARVAPRDAGPEVAAECALNATVARLRGHDDALGRWHQIEPNVDWIRWPDDPDDGGNPLREFF